MTEFNTGRIDTSGSQARLVSWDERVVPFDLAVVVPLHGKEWAGQRPLHRAR